MLKNFLIAILLITLTACTTTTTEKLPVKPAKSAADYNLELGMSYLQQGDMQRAKHKLLTALQQSPDSAKANEAMGYFQETTGDKQAAGNYYLKAVQLNPKSGRAQNNYGTFLCRSGRYQEAEQHFLMALQDASYLNTAQVYENAGLCALSVPDDAKALAYFSKAVAQDSRLSTSWLELGQITYRQANYKLAQQYLNQYMQMVAEPSAEALWLGIRVARQLNDANDAGKYTLELQGKHPNSAEYREFLKTQKQLPVLKTKRVLYL